MHERRARARAAIARMRLRRAIQFRHSVRNWFDLVLWCVLGLLVLGGCVWLGYLLVDAHGKDVFKDHPVLVAVGMGLTLGWGTILLCSVALGLTALCYGAMMPHKVVAALVRSLVQRRRVGRYFKLLEENGEVVLGKGYHRHASILRRMAREDEGLLYSDKDNSLRAKSAGPPESCPRCRADLDNPSPGIRRCGHCEFERFDEMPGRTDKLEKATKLIGAVAEGEQFSGSRKELWKRFKAKNKSEEAAMVIPMAIAALVFGGIGEIGTANDIGFVAGVGRLGAFFLGFGAGLMLPVAVYRIYALHFREFKPGVARYDQALAEDIITTLAQQGRSKTDALATHLGISRKHLEKVLKSLVAVGNAPVYSDPSNDMLISLHALKIDNKACPACGGLLDVAPGARLQCQHCGAKSLAA